MKTTLQARLRELEAQALPARTPQFYVIRTDEDRRRVDALAQPDDIVFVVTYDDVLPAEDEDADGDDITDEAAEARGAGTPAATAQADTSCAGLADET